MGRGSRGGRNRERRRNGGNRELDNVGRKRRRDDSRDRDRDRDRRRRRRERSRSPRGGDRDRRRRDRPERRARKVHSVEIDPPPVPSDFFCHLCGSRHWTVLCPRLRERPGDYPLLSRTRACWRCAQRGHAASQCPVKRYKCADCGGVHDTRDCVYNHKSEEFHEFFDPAQRHVYYVSAVDRDSRWTPPTHKLDVILWYCAKCELLIPNKYMECLKCHSPRPQSELKAAGGSDAESSSGSDSDDDSHSGSDDDVESISSRSLL